MVFTDLNLSEPIQEVIKSIGFEKPTEIQSLAIPILLEEEKDFIGLAQTGTGKTLAFGLPLIEKIDSTLGHTQGLVLAPTRELGQQIAQQLEIFSKNIKKLNVLAVYGGANISTQIKALQKPQHIIIATPGRLLDLIKRRAVNLMQLEYLVLDEADEMLTMGFKDELDAILDTTPDEKLTWLFSATMSKDIRGIVKRFMHEPSEVKLNTKMEVNKNISHFAAALAPRNKFEAIARIIDANLDMRGIVFCRTKRETQEIAENLMHLNYKADALHGDLSQAQRDRVMGHFKKHKLQVLIATDIAARGIDVQDITHVIHNDLPDDPESYTHRSGRTARAGKEGISIALVSNRDARKLEDIKRKLKIPFEEYKIPTANDIFASKIEQWSNAILSIDASHDKTIEIFESIEAKFSDLSKEELLLKLVQQQYNALSVSNKEINEKLGQQRGGDSRGGGRNRGGGGRRDGGRGRRDRKGGSGGRRDGGNSYGGRRNDSGKTGFGSKKRESKSPFSKKSDSNSKRRRRS